MRPEPGHAAAIALLLSALPALEGCPNPSSYSTPRTVAPGQFTHALSVEGFGATGTAKTIDQRTGAPKEEEVGEFLPAFPSYELRIGAAERLDIGVHLYNLTSLGIDFKLNPLRGVFDLAIDAGAQYFYLNASEDESAHVFSLTAPVMVGINPTEWLSIVLSPGVTYAIVAGTASSAEGRDALLAEGGLLFRGGIGAQFRTSSGFALHPLLTISKSFGGSAALYNAGVGFIFGDIPLYDDIAPKKRE